MSQSSLKHLKLTDRYAQKDYAGESVRFEAEVGLEAKGATLAVQRMNAWL